jgi:hypothetical protein
MATELLFKRGNYEWQFNVDNGGYSGITIYLMGSINWGMAPITRITQRGPFQDGDTDIDYRLNPRVINLPVLVPGTSYDEFANNRENLLQMFKPGNDTATFKSILNAGSFYEISRSIDVKIAGATMDSSSNDFHVRAVIQLRADDPTWYNTTQNVLQLTYTQFGTPTPYPKPYPVPYGAASVNNQLGVVYTGTVVSHPIIQCIGPLSDLVIADGAGRLISFTATIPAASIWTVDLRYGRKTIIDQDGVSKFQYLSVTSDIVNWGLYPDPTFDSGQNPISVSATGTTNVSVVNMYWYDRYVGI